MLLTHGAESLPDDLVEHVPVEPLLRFRFVSKKWKLTIDSRRFKERHLTRRKRSRGPDAVILCLSPEKELVDIEHDQIFVLGSSIARTVKLPITNHMFCCYGSCDGLVCIFHAYKPSIVSNPATGLYWSFPISNYQHLIYQMFMSVGWVDFDIPIPRLGFGKDNIRDTYKPVLLSNPPWFVPNEDNVVTYCEVFDFSTKKWRYVVPSSPYPISAYHDPVHLDGSLYWFTEREEPPMVLSFDLHTETFQVICKTPFAINPCEPRKRNMCILG